MIIRKISKRIKAKASLWLEVDNETRYQVYLNTIRGTRVSNIAYWIELLLACGIATLGLVLNSPAIIIGAMLISPLMTPIMGTGLALATGDLFLGFRAFLNLTFSILMVLGASVFFVYFLPFKESTAEILARTQPTILDLVVALLSGMAGSIAVLKSSKGLTAALPGTAIAVALLPPLCVVGFGLGTKNFDPQWAQVARGGTLLFAANLVAIILTSMIVFLAVGMGRKNIRNRVDEWQRKPEVMTRLEIWFSKQRFLKTFEKVGTLQARLLIILIFFLGIYFPLQQALTRVVRQIGTKNQMQRQVRVANDVARGIFNLPNRSEIEKIDVESTPQGLRALVRVSTNKLFNKDDRTQFESLVSKELKRPVRLVLVQSPGIFGEEKGTDWAKVLGSQVPQVPQVPQAPSASVPPPHEGFLLVLDQVQAAVQGLWPHPPEEILETRVELSEPNGGEIMPKILLSYISESDLNPDAKEIFHSGLKQILGLKPVVEFEWIPTKLGPFPLVPGRTQITPEVRDGLLNISQWLKRFPQLEAEIKFSGSPSGQRNWRRRAAEAYSLKVTQELQDQGLPEDKFTLDLLEKGPPTLLLLLKLKAPDGGPETQPETRPAVTASPVPKPKV